MLAKKKESVFHHQVHPCPVGSRGGQLTSTDNEDYMYFLTHIRPLLDYLFVLRFAKMSPGTIAAVITPTNVKEQQK